MKCTAWLVTRRGFEGKVTLALKSYLASFVNTWKEWHSFLGAAVAQSIRLFNPWRVSCARTVDAESAFHNMLHLDFK